MRPTFEPALHFLLKHEGGFSNNPADPGGVTNLGVTKRQWESYIGYEVSIDDMRALTEERVSPFYKSRYWDVVKADYLPAGLDDCMFDSCVNDGPGRAVKLLQGVLGLTEDGILGPMTLAAAVKIPPQNTIPAYCNARLSFMKTLDGWPTFGAGWTTRVREVQSEALSLTSHDVA